MIHGLIDLNLDVVDRSALVIVFVGISIVFTALLFIYLFFKYLLPVFLRLEARRKAIKLGQASHTAKMNEMTGDVNAAIAMALFLYLNEMHDKESNVITIKRVSRTYSPWSSKLYNMKNL